MLKRASFCISLFFMKPDCLSNWKQTDMQHVTSLAISKACLRFTFRWWPYLEVFFTFSSENFFEESPNVLHLLIWSWRVSCIKIYSFVFVCVGVWVLGFVWVWVDMCVRVWVCACEYVRKSLYVWESLITIYMKLVQNYIQISRFLT